MAAQPKIKAGGILRNERLAKIGVMSAPDRPGLASAVLHALADSNISAQFVVQLIDLTDHSHVVLCVAIDDLERALAALHRIKDSIGAKSITHQREVSIVSVFGPDFRERPAIAARVFEALASAGINIMAISTSISTVSCLIEGGRAEEAVAALRNHFDLP